MTLEQAILTWIHLVSASIWVGGSLFIGMVLVPILKKMDFSLKERLGIMIKVGRKFNKIAVPSLVILIVTGLYNSHLLLSKPDILFSSSYGNLLIIKIFLVIALIIIFATHIRVIRKEIEEQIMQNKMSEIQIQKLRKKIIILGEAMVILSVTILFLAALLDAGI